MFHTDVVLHALNVLCTDVTTSLQAVRLDEVDCSGGRPLKPLSIRDLTHLALCDAPRPFSFLKIPEDMTVDEETGSISLDPKDVVWTADHLDPGYDYDFSHLKDTQKYFRGEEEYQRPIGWQRFAIKVLDEYEDNTWLGTRGRVSGTDSVRGEWPVSYHGTQAEFVKAIIDENFKAGHINAYGVGVYSTPDIKIAEAYALEFQFKGLTYKVIMQNRINPKIREKYNNDKYWLVPVKDKTKEREIVKKAIRPYGLLLKQV